jgi:hypothetical protein
MVKFFNGARMVTLAESINQARAQCSVSEVWCIMRFDRNDTTLEIYWSEKNPLPRPDATTRDPYPVPHGAITSHDLGVGGTRDYGGHAECIMIRDFQRALNDYQLINRGLSPKRVEIFLSRSPCNVSDSFVLAGISYPIGCAKKLKTLILNYPQIDFWDIQYDNIYWGGGSPNPKSDKLNGSVEGIHILQSLVKVSMHRFNQLDVVP